MAEFSISYGELESRPVFNITAKCGHSFREYRRPELTVSWRGVRIVWRKTFRTCWTKPITS